MSEKYSFSNKHHIREKSEFDRVFKTNKQLKTRLGTLRYCRNNLDYPRLGLVTSKKNVRFAVSRNQLRRLVKEYFRLHQYQLCGYDVVFVAYKRAGSASKSERHQCLGQLFNMLVKRL